MGYGNYSYEAHQAITNARAGQSASEVFAQSGVHPKMNPHGVRRRECRDSPDHPNVVPICFALDISGSMGEIPELLARKELPGFMRALLAAGIADPQVIFMAFEDAMCCATPLQVGQFESTAELMDKWLTLTTFQSGGGCADHVHTGNLESYELALYFAARHTATDAWEKRGKRGYLFMTGDETGYPTVAPETVKIVIGEDIEAEIPFAAVMTELRAHWQPYFLIPDPGRRGVEPFWREVFGRDVVCMETPADTCAVAATLVALGEGALRTTAEVEQALKRNGLGPQRVAGVIKALQPWLG
jgi:hypothetical protein